MSTKNLSSNERPRFGASFRLFREAVEELLRPSEDLEAQAFRRALGGGEEMKRKACFLMFFVFLGCRGQMVEFFFH